MDFTKNHFEIFGLPTDFIIDLGELRNRYQQLQKVTHPDRFANASDSKKRQAMQNSVLLNEAYQTLKDPVTRAQYLLSLRGLKMDVQKETTQDISFLMEQMELRELLEKIPSLDDPDTALADMMDNVSQMIKSHIAKMAVTLENETFDSMEEAREIVRKLQFLNKLYAETELVEAQLEDS